MKLRITIEGKTYEAEVEILEDEKDTQDFSLPPLPPANVSPASIPVPPPAASADIGSDSDNVCSGGRQRGWSSPSM